MTDYGDRFRDKPFNWLCLGLLMISLLDVGIGRRPDSEYFQTRPATFWNGIGHGLVAPLHSLLGGGDEFPRPAQTTPGYDSGLTVGAIWFTFAFMAGLLAAMGIGASGNWLADSGGGCLLGLSSLMAVLIYWIVPGLIYLAGAVMEWFKWLLGTS